jgi:hypothetical protein
METNKAMATLTFSPFIQHFVRCPSMEVSGDSAREILESYFQEFHRVREHILDDQGGLRPRLAMFVDGIPIQDRTGLSDPIHLRARIFVQQIPLDTEYEVPWSAC